MNTVMKTVLMTYINTSMNILDTYGTFLNLILLLLNI